jgi:hypothetical protein
LRSLDPLNESKIVTIRMNGAQGEKGRVVDTDVRGNSAQQCLTGNVEKLRFYGESR